MLHSQRFSVTDAVAELETAVGIYLLFEQEAGATSVPATGALTRVKHALALVQWCRGLADELRRETGHPVLHVLSGGLSGSRAANSTTRLSDRGEA